MANRILFPQYSVPDLAAWKHRLSKDQKEKVESFSGKGGFCQSLFNGHTYDYFFEFLGIDRFIGNLHASFHRRSNYKDI